MFAIRRWWNRYALQAGLITLAVGTAWVLRETQGAVIYETYRTLSRPFYAEAPPEEQRQSAYVLELQERIVELESQNQVLQESIESHRSAPEGSIAAAVIGRSADHWWQQVVLAKGSNQGIQEGYVVVGPGGLVGRIVNVSPNTSRALLISDPTSRVGAKVSRSRAMGYIQGQANNRVLMEFFEKEPDVKAGDVVTTSSYSQLFPADVPVGRIESIDLTRSPAPAAIIQLSSPLGSLEWVTVIPYQSPIDKNPTIPPGVTDSSDNSETTSP